MDMKQNKRAVEKKQLFVENLDYGIDLFFIYVIT